MSEMNSELRHKIIKIMKNNEQIKKEQRNIKSSIFVLGLGALCYIITSSDATITINGALDLQRTQFMNKSFDILRPLVVAGEIGTLASLISSIKSKINLTKKNSELENELEIDESDGKRL